MKAVVVFESMFGNTGTVAAAIADGLAAHAEVSLVNVANPVAELAQDVDLLVVGAPTHAFGLSGRAPGAPPSSRAAGPATTGWPRADRLPVSKATPSSAPGPGDQDFSPLPWCRPEAEHRGGGVGGVAGRTCTGGVSPAASGTARR